MNTGELILTIYVNCKECFSVRTKHKTINQVLFDGRAEGKYFKGKILPGGVDTQTSYTDKNMSLSARYMMEGIDDKGKQCRIYIDNEAEMGNKVTKPQIVTDSESLSWLEDANLYGIIDDTDGLKIKIYCDHK